MGGDRQTRIAWHTGVEVIDVCGVWLSVSVCVCVVSLPTSIGHAGGWECGFAELALLLLVEERAAAVVRLLHDKTHTRRGGGREGRTDGTD